MTKIEGRNIDKSYEIYMALYQAVSGTEDWQNVYKNSPEIFSIWSLWTNAIGAAR